MITKTLTEINAQVLAAVSSETEAKLLALGNADDLTDYLFWVGELGTQDEIDFIISQNI